MTGCAKALGDVMEMGASFTGNTAAWAACGNEIRLRGSSAGQLVDGIQSDMDYLGSAALSQLRLKARYTCASPPTARLEPSEARKPSGSKVVLCLHPKGHYSVRAAPPDAREKPVPLFTHRPQCLCPVLKTTRHGG